MAVIQVVAFATAAFFASHGSRRMKNIRAALAIAVADTDSAATTAAAAIADY